jgi:hypothetical protein
MVAAVVLAAAGLGLVVPGTASAAQTGDVYVIHGLIGQTLDVLVDGKTSMAAATPKSIVGPLHLATGNHEVTLKKGSDTVASADVAVKAGASLDVVAHLKSDAAQGAEITSYSNDLKPVAGGKLRLAIAHVAAAPPADITVDGKTLFSNVANGEALTIVVPANTYRVAVVPAATGGDAILGPVDLTVKAGTLTRVFAVGDVTKGSMDAVVHSLPVRQTGSGAPDSVRTGDGGQAATSFVDDDAGRRALLAAVLAVTGLLAIFGIGSALRRRYRP